MSNKVSWLIEVRFLKLYNKEEKKENLREKIQENMEMKM